MHLTTPLAQEHIDRMRAGDTVALSGTVYTARDAAHKRLIELIEKNQELPFDLRGQIIYYVGPTPARPGQAIGAAGPTTSYRMDPYTPILLDHGLKGMIGKGDRSQKVSEAIIRTGSVYFTCVGGTAALISSHITRAEVIAFPELGPEAIYRLEVDNLPLIVTIDATGSNAYHLARKRLPDS